MHKVGRRARGQTGTEYMLVVSVIVIAVVGAAYVFVPRFEEGVNELGRDVSQLLATGDVGGIGHGGTNANASVPKTSPGPTSSNEGISNGGTGLLGDGGIANGGFSGMHGNNGLGQPPAVNGATAPSGMANGGGSATPP